MLKLAITDFKLIFRNPSLRAFLVFPFILYALVVWFLPGIVEKFDFLLPYLPAFLVIWVIENTQMFSFISSMVLIDEKESDVARVYGVAPLTKVQYLFSRLFLPYVITVLLNVGLLAVQPFYEIGWIANLTISLLTALVVPVYVLGINSLVENRMQGLVYVKAFNMLVLIPIAAFFVPDWAVHLFGIFPTHWIFQSISQGTAGEAFGWYALVGFVFFGVLMYVLARTFLRKHFK